MSREVVVITGADNGIGLAITRELLSSGLYLVGALDLSSGELSGLQSEYPECLRFHICDVTDEAGVGEAVGAIAAEWGKVDVLVNNACLALFGKFEVKRVSDTRKEFEVNYFGAINMIRSVLPYMKAAGQGVIHNISSGVGISGFPGIYGYASTKGAIESLSRTLAIELSPCGITVNLIHPPLTRTRSSSPLGYRRRPWTHLNVLVNGWQKNRIKKEGNHPGFQNRSKFVFDSSFSGFYGTYVGKAH